MFIFMSMIALAGGGLISGYLYEYLNVKQPSVVWGMGYVTGIVVGAIIFSIK